MILFTSSGIPAVVAAETRLDMRARNSELGSYERGRHRGIHVTVHHDPVRPLRLDDGLEALHYPRSLYRVRVRTDLEIDVGVGRLRSRKNAADSASS